MRLVSFQRFMVLIIISNAILYAVVTFLLGVLHQVWPIVLVGPMLFLVIRLIPMAQDTDDPGLYVLLVYWGTWVVLGIAWFLWHQ